MSVQQKLRTLFLLDTQLRGMRSRLDGATTRFERQKNKLAQIERQRTELAEQVKLNAVKASALEKQVKDVDTRVETLRNQMNSVKNNKEYSALLIEVNTLKIDKSKIEDQAIEQLGKVEELKAQAAELDLKATEQQKLVGAAEAEVTAFRG
jgi:predicted  nucleic acid-binding Zn-ribbon protein